MRAASILIAACLFAAIPASADPITDAANKLLELLYPKPPPVVVPPPAQPPVIAPPAPAPKATRPPKGKPKAKRPKAKPKPKARPPAGLAPPQQRPTAAQCAEARTWIRRIGMEATILAGMAYPPGFTRDEVERGLRQCGLLR